MTITEEAALPEPVGLISSGIETLSAGWGGYLKAVVAEDGAIWALAEGRLVRYDPVVGAAETWSIDDDERFFATDVLPAGVGGVWLLSDRMVRRFDGAGFRQAIDVGAYVNAATEAPDGTLWAATADGEIVHVTGERRIRIDALPPTSGGFISAMAVDAAGGVWCGWQRPWGWGDGVAWVSRYDGAWRVMDRRDIARPGSFVRAIAAPSDGSVWVVTDSRLVRFEGSTREDYGPGEPLRGDSPVAVAVGAEGALWVDLGNRIGRFAGRSWELVAWVAIPEEGVTSILPTRDAVFVAAGGSIYRHVSDGWCAAWSSNAPAGPAPTPMFPTHIVAVSRDEAWVADTAIWRVTGGAWSPAAQGAGGAVRALLRTPDGTLWWTVEDGSLYVLRGTRAEKLASGSLRGLAADAAGLAGSPTAPFRGPTGLRRDRASAPSDRLGALAARGASEDARRRLRWSPGPGSWPSGAAGRSGSAARAVTSSGPVSTRPPQASPVWSRDAGSRSTRGESTRPA